MLDSVHDFQPIIVAYPGREALMPPQLLRHKRVAFVLAAEFEDLEFYVPLMRMQEEGAETVVAAKTKGEYRGKGGLYATADTLIGDLKPYDLDALVVPGGWAPDKLRRDQKLLSLLQVMNAHKKILGFICHAGWVAASAELVTDGRPVTGSVGIRDDLTIRGAVWRDEAAFRDENLVWGRVVADIPAFCRELVDAIAKK
jgi:protease I